MSSYTHPVPRAFPLALRHLAWFALVCWVAFLVPYLGISALGMQHDLYTLLLTVFPALVAYRLLDGRVDRLKGKLRLTALALPLVLVVTAAYHVGYPQFRHDGVSRPETGNVLISIPTFASGNPVGSFVAHVSQHVAAVTRAYESRIFNPPVTKT
jgi:hypothetical protein